MGYKICAFLTFTEYKKALWLKYENKIGNTALIMRFFILKYDQKRTKK